MVLGHNLSKNCPTVFAIVLKKYICEIDAFLSVYEQCGPISHKIQKSVGGRIGTTEQ